MPRTSTLPLRTPLAIAAVMGLALTGCTGDTTDDEGDDVAGSTPEPTATETSSSSPSPTDPASDLEATPSPTDEQTPVTASVEVPDLDAQCELEPDLPQVDRILYAVPSAWQVDGSCTELDPDTDQVEEGTEAELAIFASVSDVSYAEVNADSPASRDVVTWLGARADLQAARQTSVSTGEALAPEGQPATRWAVDLDPGADEDGGVLTLSTGGVDGEAYDLAQATLDSIAQTVVVQPAASDGPDEGFTVVRTEGGGMPYAVTYDGDCFALRPGGPADEPTDERCDLEPTSGPLVAGSLGDGVLVGYAPATAIAVQSDALASPYGLTASIEGGTVFAFRAEEVPAELTAVGPGGEELVSAPVD